MGPQADLIGGMLIIRVAGRHGAEIADSLLDLARSFHSHSTIEPASAESDHFQTTIAAIFNR